MLENIISYLRGNGFENVQLWSIGNEELIFGQDSISGTSMAFEKTLSLDKVIEKIIQKREQMK